MVRLGVEVALLAARGEAYLPVLGQGFASLLGVEAGVGLVSWTHQTASRSGPDVDVDVEVSGGPALSPAQLREGRAVVSRHPTYAVIRRAGTSCPVRTSDHVPIRSFWSTDVWRYQHGFCDGRYPVGFAVSCTADTVRFVGLHRSRRDFDDAELVAIGIVQNLLATALRFRASLDEAAIRLGDPGLVTALDGTAAHPSSPPAGVDRGLGGYRPTRREAEVLALAASGWTSGQIGRRLGISERTVRKHLGAVYGKAGVPGRAAAAAWWQRQGGAVT
jgi:DNA-binding CsgD family transcriptional regulator